MTVEVSTWITDTVTVVVEDPTVDDTTTTDTDDPTWDPDTVYVTDNVRCIDNLSPLACVVRPPDDTTPPTTPPPPPTTVRITYPTVYATDLVSFRPAGPVFTAEPDGAGLIGKPMNFVASADDQDLSGTVLGFPVSVHFTPVSYAFDYGDGSSITSADGGATWASTGAAQFTETPTSHTYAARGTYTTSSSVDYAAWVNFGDGMWRPVIGRVTAPGPSRDVRIYEPKSALVIDACTAKPRGLGC